MVFRVVISAVLCSSQVAIARQPNILFLLIDDMGWSDLACYGHPFHETPNIDRLAREGVRFTNFYAATPVCSSTRSTIQTGQYSARTGITDFLVGHWRPYEKLVVPPLVPALRPGIQTPGHRLKAAGYTTAYFGKWHLGRRPSDQPDHWGYDVTADQLGDRFRRWRGDRSAGPKRIDLLTDQTIYFIEQFKDRPFFVTLSHHAVHIPIETTKDALEKYESKSAPKDGVNNPAYAGMTEDLDRSIGRIVNRLEQLGLAGNTVIILTSDNGGLRLTYTGVGDIVSTNYPLRGEKGTLYEGGIRVPLIVKWPGVAPQASRNDQVATTADLLPTFCDIAHADMPPQPLDGISLLPVLQHEKQPLQRDSIFFHYPHYHHSSPAGALREGEWKLIEFFEDGRLELYHLGGDLGETTNLTAHFPRRTRRMQRSLAAWRERVGARMPTQNPDYDAARTHLWMNRRTKEPIDIEARRRQYERRKAAGPLVPAGDRQR